MRFNVPSDVAMKPGPGAYLPEKVLHWIHCSTNLLTLTSCIQTNQKANQPQYSFGVKHSKYMFGARPLPGEETRPLPY